MGYTRTETWVTLGDALDHLYTHVTTIRVCCFSQPSWRQFPPALSTVWNQPEDWLQMARTLCNGRCRRVGQPVAPSQAFAWELQRGHSGQSRCIAARAPDVGRAQATATFAGSSGCAGAGSEHLYPDHTSGTAAFIG